MDTQDSLPDGGSLVEDSLYIPPVVEDSPLEVEDSPPEVVDSLPEVVDSSLEVEDSPLVVEYSLLVEDSPLEKDSPLEEGSLPEVEYSLLVVEDVDNPPVLEEVDDLLDNTQMKMDNTVLLHL